MAASVFVSPGFSTSATAIALQARLRVTRTSTTQWRVLVPVTGASATTYTEWRLKTIAGTNCWSLQGCYGRNLLGAEVQLSDTTDTSVYEYAWKIGVTDAAVGSFDFFGMGHGSETLLTATFALDGVSLSGIPVGACAFGASFAVAQTIDTRLPKNADGTVNGVTLCGDSTLTHTFTASGLTVAHTHTIDAGYQVYTAYGAMCPNSAANINQVQLNALAVYTPVGNDLAQDAGTEILTFKAWHSTAHQYRMTMTLTGFDWAGGAPNKGFFLDNASRKCYALFWTDAYAGRANTGTTSHTQTYAVDYR